MPCFNGKYYVLKMKNLFEKFELLQLVSEPWFEGFGCTFGGN